MRREEQFIDKKALSIFELQIDYLNWENSVRNNDRANFSQSKRSHCGVSHPTEKLFKQQRKKKAIRNNYLIYSTLIISIINVMVGNQIRASDADRRIISLKISRNWTLWIRNFTGTCKRLKLVHTYGRK